MNYLDYRKALGIGFNDAGKCKYFLQRMHNFLNCIEDHSPPLSPQDQYYYADTTGTDYEEIYSDYGFDGIRDDILCCKDLKEFLARYIVLVNILNDKNTYPALSRSHFIQALCVNMDAARIPFQTLEDPDGFFLFPKGAEELDTPLVSQPLQWLSEFPKARIAFIKALKEYANAMDDNASDIADLFRKALETFMKEFFNTPKALENCKSIYGAYLKERGVPAEISCNLETLLQAYANYMNGYAKHQDRTNVNILEYIMYQTGNIIRLLITLKQEETRNAD